MANSFGAHSKLPFAGSDFRIASLEALEKAGAGSIAQLPLSIKVILESLLRREDGRHITADHVRAAAAWVPKNLPDRDVPFLPARVLLQDLTGVPVVVDLAAMRDAASERGIDPARVNPLIRADLVIDHSVQVDYYARGDAVSLNVKLEYARNHERFAFLRWGNRAFSNFTVVPPGTGICHQVNLEYFASVVERKDGWAYPDSCIGTDSHTTMIGGLGVVGWGVGGIEAEAAMLGLPMPFVLPPVVGFRLTGQLPAGSTATDLVLTVTQMLRKKGVVGKFVEFFGDGLGSLTLPDRATIANMAPEYGATIGYFPVDAETIAYLKLTGRTEEQCQVVEAYCKAQGLWRGQTTPVFSETMDLDLTTVEPSLAGPKRPQDRVPLNKAKAQFVSALTAPVAQGGFGLTAHASCRRFAFDLNGQPSDLGHGSIVIAAITSCTNTSNPTVLVAAGLLAQKAVAAGLRVPSHVKTSLAPGSRVVTEYLKDSRLIEPLETLGFNVVGFGCTTCIGNSGPLPDPIAHAVTQADLVVASVLSGNRNFESRVHSQVRANYLASPPLVVAYALAGRMDVDLPHEPLGQGTNGPVFLRDLWPSAEEVTAVVRRSVRSEMFRERYARVFDGDESWRAMEIPQSSVFVWPPTSTYVRKPPYFEPWMTERLGNLRGARVLVMLGDSVTTDHISPAGSIAQDSPAARYLLEQGVQPSDFNQYGARRGNHEVMVRGTFANVRIKNLLVPGVEGPVTIHLPSGQTMSIYDAAMEYAKQKTPLLVIAGKEYGTGSSRDWAAKGTRLLGCRVVLAESYERIHRSNLVGMGVLPLEFTAGQTPTTLGLDGTEVFDLAGIDILKPRSLVHVIARRLNGGAAGAAGRVVEFDMLARVDTAMELDVLFRGGILPAVLARLAT